MRKHLSWLLPALAVASVTGVVLVLSRLDRRDDADTRLLRYRHPLQAETIDAEIAFLEGRVVQRPKAIERGGARAGVERGPGRKWIGRGGSHGCPGGVKGMGAQHGIAGVTR